MPISTTRGLATVRQRLNKLAGKGVLSPFDSVAITWTKVSPPLNSAHHFDDLLFFENLASFSAADGVIHPPSLTVRHLYFPPIREAERNIGPPMQEFLINSFP